MFKKLYFFTCRFLQLWIERISCSQQVVLIFEFLYLGSLSRLRQTTQDKLIDFLRSCHGTMVAIFTIEQEDAVRRYLRYTFEVLSASASAQLLKPLVCVVLVKLIGVSFIAECENDAQVVKLQIL